METLYRKVAVSERKPKRVGTYFTNEGEVFYSSTYKEFQHDYDPHKMYPEWWLEEIPAAQLQADKEELIEKLEEIYDYLGSHFDGEKVSIGELIQKHKK